MGEGRDTREYSSDKTGTEEARVSRTLLHPVILLSRHLYPRGTVGRYGTQ